MGLRVFQRLGKFEAKSWVYGVGGWGFGWGLGLGSGVVLGKPGGE